MRDYEDGRQWMRFARSWIRTVKLRQWNGNPKMMKVYDPFASLSSGGYTASQGLEQAVPNNNTWNHDVQQTTTASSFDSWSPDQITANLIGNNYGGFASNIPEGSTQPYGPYPGSSTATPPITSYGPYNSMTVMGNMEMTAFPATQNVQGGGVSQQITPQWWAQPWPNTNP